MTTQFDLESVLYQLESAESFLDYFKVPFNEQVIQHKRIHLLKLFHQELGQTEQQPSWASCQSALKKAYCKIMQGQSAQLAASKCQSCNQCED